MSTAWQVRLVWGDAAAIRWPVDVIIWADARGRGTGIERDGALHLSADLDGAAAAASAALAEQARLGRRAMITVVAAGDRTAEGAWVPTAADELVAGAVIDELAALGIDFHCPASAIACAAATTLRGARRALIRADLESRRSE